LLEERRKAVYAILARLGIEQSTLIAPDGPPINDDGIVIFEKGVLIGHVAWKNLPEKLRWLRGTSGAPGGTGIFVIVAGRVQSFIPVDELPP
jgi:hypothetical protein